MIPMVSRKRLSAMAIGDTSIFRERPSVKNAGASVQSYAMRAFVTVQTKRCFIVIPSDEQMVKAVAVTRLK